MQSASTPNRTDLLQAERAALAPMGVRKGEVRRFQPTRWSLVLRAGGAEGRRAASELCRAYWHPVQAFFRSQGAREDEASDLTQGFFTDLHARDAFGKLDASRGKFRSWLCACAINYLRNERKRERSLKRGGGAKGVSLNAESSDERGAPGLQELQELQELRDPQRLFDRRWARAVISRALARLRDHYAECDQGEIFQSLEGKSSGEGAELSDAALAALLGKSEDAVRQKRFQMQAPVRKRFARFVRAEIAETVAAREQINDEIRDLLRALA